MGKKALCVKKTDVWQAGTIPVSVGLTARVLPFEERLLKLPTELIDRSICETDPSTLQLIPYILVIHPEGNQFYQYTRGNGGGEDRLHEKLSVGLGGHVDQAPADGEQLEWLLMSEASRELQEELGLTGVHWTEIDIQGVVYEEVTEVGKVHLGILCSYQLTKEELPQLTLEENQITEGRWVDLAHLQQKEVYDRLELWSQAVVDWLATIGYDEEGN